MTEKVKIGMVSLGCSKNTVDAELMLGKLKSAVLTANPAEADVIIVNTCGFIEAAKQESINAILEMAEYKKQGSLKGLVVTGCLSQRYQDELARELPEVDVFLGVTAAEDIAGAVESALAGQHQETFRAPTVAGDYENRVLTTPPHYAYLKIAEGCSNRCSYCAIPDIRGPLQSRPIEDILREARSLVLSGARELIVIAQDTTKYGQDLYGQPCLPELLRRLAEESGARWIRVLYCYPESITDELLDVMAGHDNIVKYIDIPVQHLDDGILRRMNRRSRQATVYDAVRRIRQADPRFIIRTTLIAGFPGETEEAFQTMLRGVRELRFDRLGAFAYSAEEGTPAAEFPGQLPQEVKEARAGAVMEAQQPIARASNEGRLGQTLDVVIEGFDGERYFGRSYGEAPDIDGLVYVESEEELLLGEWYPVRITGADEYDISGVAE